MKSKKNIQCFKEWWLYEYIGKDKISELSQSKKDSKQAKKRMLIQHFIKQLRNER